MCNSECCYDDKHKTCFGNKCRKVEHDFDCNYTNCEACLCIEDIMDRKFQNAKEIYVKSLKDILETLEDSVLVLDESSFYNDHVKTLENLINDIVI